MTFWRSTIFSNCLELVAECRRPLEAQLLGGCLHLSLQASNDLFGATVQKFAQVVNHLSGNPAGLITPMQGAVHSLIS